MTLSLIRDLRKEDVKRLEACAMRFLDRHGEEFEWGFAGCYRAEVAFFQMVDRHIDSLTGTEVPNPQRLQRLWKRNWRRAIKEPSADVILIGNEQMAAFRRVR